jgi:hypothetical protein
VKLEREFIKTPSVHVLDNVSYADGREGIMNEKFRTQYPSGPAPITPVVYVKNKTVWEYKLVTRNLKEGPPSEEQLNTLGKDGWELAGTVTDSPFAFFYFKRLKE